MAKHYNPCLAAAKYWYLIQDLAVAFYLNQKNEDVAEVYHILYQAYLVYNFLFLIRYTTPLKIATTTIARPTYTIDCL